MSFDGSMQKAGAAFTREKKFTKLQQQYAVKAVLEAYRCGKFLIDASQQAKHGEYLRSLPKHGLSQSAASVRRQIYERWDEIPDRLKSESVNKCITYLEGKNRRLDDRPLTSRSQSVNDLWHDLEPSGNADKDFIRRAARRRKTAAVLKQTVRRLQRSPVFLDSGAFAQKKKAEQHAEDHPKGKSWYDLGAYAEYLDDYIRFIQLHDEKIDLYSNLDVIGDPDRSARNLETMRAEGLNPVPVLHHGTDPVNLEGMVSESPVIALGGLVREAQKEHCQQWIADCFDAVKEYQEMGYPCRVHGFGLTSFDLMREFPWASVDSTSWLIGRFGDILVPQRVDGQFVFDQQWDEMHVSKVKTQKRRPKPTPELVDRAKAWVKECGRDCKLKWDDLAVEEKGYKARHRVNLKYYERLQQVHDVPPIYYSGTGGANPEHYLRAPRVMPSFADLRDNFRASRLYGLESFVEDGE